jgi:hypothetical protein
MYHKCKKYLQYINASGIFRVLKTLNKKYFLRLVIVFDR